MRFGFPILFLVLALVFTIAARNDFVKNDRQWSPVVKTRFRVAVAFGIVGLLLLLRPLVFS